MFSKRLRRFLLFIFFSLSLLTIIPDFFFTTTPRLGGPLNINLNAGFRFQKKDEEGMSYFIQPMVTVYPLSVTTSDLKAVPYTLSLQLGAVFSASKK